MTVLKSEALASLKPGAEFVWTGSAWSGLNWIDTKQTKPSEAEVDTEVTRLTNLEIANKYKEQRRAEYPTIGDQLDQLYWDKKNGTNKWVEAIDKVKSDNPKP